MKTLQALANSVGGKVNQLTFNRIYKGYSITDADNNELLVVEPCFYSNGDRWIIKNYCNTSLTYVKRLNNIKETITAGHTGYKYTV